jgi:hypothetical protein
MNSGPLEETELDLLATLSHVLAARSTTMVWLG